MSESKVKQCGEYAGQSPHKQPTAKQLARDSRLMSDDTWLATRFWPKVDIDSGCWEWNACLHTKGYGQVIYRGRKYRAHRVLKAISDGVDVATIPTNVLACHHCDNRKCVRPDHIFWGSPDDNMQDAIRKGRRSRTSYGNRNRSK